MNQIPEPTDAQHAPGTPADTAQPAAAAVTSAEETHEVADEINIAELPAHLNPAHEDFDPSAGLERWAEQMDVYTGPDAMLDFNQVDYVHIDLSEANPSGLAQLLAGRKTRLSTILRDKSQLEAGMRSILVMTGSTRADQIAQYPYRPTVVLDGIADVVPLVEQLTPGISEELGED